MHDLVIKNGKIVDGTGASAFVGDVAVDEGRISAVGKLNGVRAHRSIDADGHLVTPGWVDSHTHFDGQASWDPLLTPSSNQGTTTVIMGNCGVGFAPCKPDQRESLIHVMEDIEDIPGSALTEGISWEWESYPEYLNALERSDHAIDIGSQVPHCAVRCYVMGEAGANNEAATPEQIDRMTAIVREGIAAGAIGFTTSRTKLHVTRHGSVMPGTYADEHELLGIGRALGDLGRGVYGLVSDFDDWENEMDWMKRLSINTGRPVNFVLFFRKESEFARIQAQLDYVRQAAKEGAQLVPHVSARPGNIMMNFNSTVHPFMFFENFAPLAELSPTERIRRLQDPALRQAILAEKVVIPQIQVPDAQDVMAAIITGFDQMYRVESPPDYEPTPDKSIAVRAAAMGVPPRQLAYDILCENNGREMIYFPHFGYGTGDMSRQMQMLKDANSVVSLADSGAHCGVLCDATMPSFLLSYLVRDRERGERIGLEWAVKSHTQDTARCVGITDRGTLEPGMKADINVIDFEQLQLDKPQVVFDLPAGGRRITQTVQGYRAIIVSGEPIFERGEHTGALPGKLIRMQ